MKTFYHNNLKKTLLINCLFYDTAKDTFNSCWRRFVKSVTCNYRKVIYNKICFIGKLFIKKKKLEVFKMLKESTDANVDVLCMKNSMSIVRVSYL